tara:strand:- start:61 stop:267 length:207 start_codon:yes stop_codon:yes gene_type:complete
MAIVAKSFIHEDTKIVGASGDADGVLAEDIQDYVTANIGTADITTQLNITCTALPNNKIFTLVVLEAN